MLIDYFFEGSFFDFFSAIMRNFIITKMKNANKIIEIETGKGDNKLQLLMLYVAVTSIIEEFSNAKARIGAVQPFSFRKTLGNQLLLSLCCSKMHQLESMCYLDTLR